MKETLNATCHLCGKKYHRCDSCDKLNNVFVTWKTIADTEDHFNAFNIVTSYSLGKIKKNEAAKQLKNYDLSDIDSWEDEEMKSYVKELVGLVPKKTVVDETESK